MEINTRSSLKTEAAIMKCIKILNSLKLIKRKKYAKIIGLSLWYNSGNGVIILCMIERKARCRISPVRWGPYKLYLDIIEDFPNIPFFPTTTSDFSSSQME